MTPLAHAALQGVLIYFIFMLGFIIVGHTYYGPDDWQAIMLLNFAGANFGYFLGGAYFRQERARLGRAERQRN